LQPPLVNLQFTPLYSGQPFAPNNTASIPYKVLKSGNTIEVINGGGVLESFAFNQSIPVAEPIVNGSVNVVQVGCSL